MTDAEIARIDERSKRNEGRIKVLEQRQDDLDKMVAAIAVIQQEIGHIREDLTETKTDVKELAEKPAKRWDSITNIILTVIISGVCGYLLSLFFGG